MPRPISYAVFCLKKKNGRIDVRHIAFHRRSAIHHRHAGEANIVFQTDLLALQHAGRRALNRGLFILLMMPLPPRPTLFPYTTLFRSALHTKRQNLFQELDAVIHLLMEAKHWGLRKSRNATSLNSRFKSLDTLKVKIISVTFRRVIRTNHKKASKIWRHENIQLGGCQS